MTVEKWLYDEYRLYFPMYASMTEDYYQEGQWDLVAKLSDGSRIMYDGLQRSVRGLPSSNDISEEQLQYEFSKRLYKILRRRGISQLELSRLTGIHNVLISRYISRKTIPSLHNINKIAKALGCSIDDLVLTYKKDWD